MEGASPARLYATLVGGALVIGGVVGFFYDSSFDVGNGIGSSDAFGVLSVNGWHNVFHIVTGALGLLFAGYAARAYALGLGVLYLLIALAGMIHLGGGDTDSILKIVPVNTGDDILHLVLGLLGLAAAAATPARKHRPETALGA